MLGIGFSSEKAECLLSGGWILTVSEHIGHSISTIKHTQQYNSSVLLKKLSESHPLTAKVRIESSLGFQCRFCHFRLCMGNSWVWPLESLGRLRCVCRISSRGRDISQCNLIGCRRGVGSLRGGNDSTQRKLLRWLWLKAQLCPWCGCPAFYLRQVQSLLWLVQKLVCSCLFRLSEDWEDWKTFGFNQKSNRFNMQKCLFHVESAASVFYVEVCWFMFGVY